MEYNITAYGGYPQATLGDLAIFINGDRGVNYPKHTDFVKSGVPFVNTGHIDPDGKLASERMQYISKEKFDKLRSGKLRRGDIVYCLRGSTIGKIATVDYDRGAIASSLVIIRAKEGVCQKYLYYFLSSAEGQRLVKEHDNGSAQPNLSVNAISKFPIPHPPLPEQQKIAHTLGTLDDKIELNRQTNQTLESMAQAMFKSWFVDFDPVIDNALAAGNPIPEPLQKRAEIRQALRNSGEAKSLPAHIQKLFPDSFRLTDEMGWVPEGWEVKRLKDLTLKIGSGATPRGGKEAYKEQGISQIRSLNVFDGNFSFKDLVFIDEHQADKLKNVVVLENDVLLNITGASVARCCIVPPTVIPARVNQHVCIIRANETVINPQYIYQCLTTPAGKSHLLNLANAGATREALTKLHIEDFRALIPEKNLMDLFASNVCCIQNRIFRNSEVNTTLSSLRDSLLPKLISGELRIPEAEAHIQEAVA